MNNFYDLTHFFDANDELMLDSILIFAMENFEIANQRDDVCKAKTFQPLHFFLKGEFKSKI